MLVAGPLDSTVQPSGYAMLKRKSPNTSSWVNVTLPGSKGVGLGVDVGVGDAGGEVEVGTSVGVASPPQATANARTAISVIPRKRPCRRVAFI